MWRNSATGGQPVVYHGPDSPVSLGNSRAAPRWRRSCSAVLLGVPTGIVYLRRSTGLVMHLARVFVRVTHELCCSRNQAVIQNSVVCVGQPFQENSLLCLHPYYSTQKAYNPYGDSCPASPVAVPMTMAYPGPAPAGYVMFPVMLSGAPDSPRGGLTPLMGSPVSTPTGESHSLPLPCQL